MSTPRILGTVTPVRSAAGNAELVVLGPSLGTTTALWDSVVGDIARDNRVVRFDLPGHGVSPAATEPFSVGDIADAVIALVDSIGGGSFHYAGISLGGAVGIDLAVRYPDRVSSLAVICSAPRIGTPAGWTERAALVRASGTASVVASSAERWYAPGFLDRDAAAGAPGLAALVDVDDESYALCCDALAVFDARDAVRGIRMPVFAVAGEVDVAVPPALVEEFARSIPGSRFEVIPGVGHLPSIEAPDAVAAIVRSNLPPNRHAAATYAAGMTVRRAVLGDAHVDRAAAAITPETADFQDFITRYAWGEVWTRPGLDRKQRSLLTIAALITGGHTRELAMHVRAALTNGLTRDEISEAILHTAIYAGLPAANSAFGVAREVFAALDTEED